MLLDLSDIRNDVIHSPVEIVEILIQFFVFADERLISSGRHPLLKDGDRCIDLLLPSPKYPDRPALFLVGVPFFQEVARPIPGLLIHFRELGGANAYGVVGWCSLLRGGHWILFCLIMRLVSVSTGRSNKFQNDVGNI